MTPALLRKLVAAGIGCNFGIDGVTAHTLKLQHKGYTIETVKQCLSRYEEAGIKVQINLLVGVPGETEQDVDDTIQFVIDHKSFITEVWAIAPFRLMHGCVFWKEPEKNNICFLGDKEFLYDKYFHGIPDRYWYSVNPYIDGAVRRKRAYKVMTSLRNAGVPVSYWAEDVIMRPMFDLFQDHRDLISEIPSLASRIPEDVMASELPCSLTNYLQSRSIVRFSRHFLAFADTDIPVLQGCPDINMYSNNHREATAVEKPATYSGGSLPLVSIILFCKNAAKTIERSVKSILSLDYPNIEYVVQDGASTDGTLDILNRHADQFGPKMTLVSEPDTGGPDAFHRALNRCKGSIIGTCLSDEELLPNAVTFAVHQFQEHPDAGVIHGDIYNIDLEGNILSENPAKEFDLVEYLSHHGSMHFAASFFRREALQKAELFNHDWSDDFEIWCCLSLRAKIVHVPVILAKYAISSNQLSEHRALMPDLIANRARFIDKFLRNEEVPQDVRNQRNNILTQFNTWAVQTLAMKNLSDEAKKYQDELQRLKTVPVDSGNAPPSKVLLVSLPGLNTGNEPIFPLGIGYLLAAIRQDRPAQAVHYQVFEHATQQLPEILSAFQPQIVGLTCSTFNRGNVRKICAWLRKHHPKVKIILGGVHVSFLTEQALCDYGADCVVIGEGELTFRELCHALDKGTPLGDVKGIAFRDGEQIITTEPREVIHNLDDLPLPDYSYAGDLMRKSGMGFVITSRGCPVRCHFCSTGSYWGQRVRVNSPRRVVDEMEALISHYGVKKIFFHDDTFNLGTKRVGEICDEIKARRLNVEWGVSCRVHPVSQEMIDRMVETGCRHICWGIESGSVQMLSRMNKKITQEQIRRAYELCRKHMGTISVGAFTMVGNPGESEETIAESARFIDTLSLTDPPSTAILCILPGTQLYQDVKAKHPEFHKFWAESDGVPLYNLENPLEWLQRWSGVISRSGNLVSFDRNRHFWNNVLFGNVPVPSVPALSFLDAELNRVIPPEIKGDELYDLIRELARTEQLSTVLEIGSVCRRGNHGSVCQRAVGKSPWSRTPLLHGGFQTPPYGAGTAL